MWLGGISAFTTPRSRSPMVADVVPAQLLVGHGLRLYVQVDAVQERTAEPAGRKNSPNLLVR